MILLHRFETIFRRHLNAALCKDNEYLWRHVNESLADFEMPTYDRETGMSCILKRTRMHPHMMLYAMDEMFHVFRGVGANNVDGQCIVAYEILTLASLCCTEWCGCAKKHCNTLGNAYPLVNLTNVDNLEHLAWAVYDGVFIPGDPPVLTGHHDWSHIITGMTLHLIFHGKTMGEHCLPCTTASFNAKQATRFAMEQGLQQPDRRKS